MKRISEKRFWILWLIGAIIAGAVSLCSSWSEDTLLLALAFALSLIAIVIIHKIRYRTALCSILFWLVYNALLSFGLLFKSEGGAGFTWWFYLLLLNVLQFVVLAVYALILYIKNKQSPSK